MVEPFIGDFATGYIDFLKGCTGLIATYHFCQLLELHYHIGMTALSIM